MSTAYNKVTIGTSTYVDVELRVLDDGGREVEQISRFHRVFILGRYLGDDIAMRRGHWI